MLVRGLAGAWLGGRASPRVGCRAQECPEQQRLRRPPSQRHSHRAIEPAEALTEVTEIAALRNPSPPELEAAAWP